MQITIPARDMRQMGMATPGAVMNKYAHTARPPLAQAYVQSSDNAR